MKTGWNENSSVRVKRPGFLSWSCDKPAGKFRISLCLTKHLAKCLNSVAGIIRRFHLQCSCRLIVATWRRVQKRTERWCLGPVGNCDLIDLHCLTCGDQIVCACVQSCLTLCDTLDCRPPGSSVLRILQARVLLVAPRKPRGLDQ